MCEDMCALLNATLDGELHGWRLLEMQTHLASCPSCQNELVKLRNVSDQLHAIPEPEFTSTERFIARLALKLPNRPLIAQPPRLVSLAWWLVPAGLIVAWFFMQTVLTLNGILSIANASNLLGNASKWFPTGAAHTTWFAAATSLFDNQAAGASQTTLSFLDQASLFGANLLTQLFWPVVIALAYWTWLAIWWMLRGTRTVIITTTSIG